MVCPRCGKTISGSVGRCAACGAAFAQESVATRVIPVDTTGLPPGATFGPVTGAGATIGGAVTGAAAAADAVAAGPLTVGQSFGPRYHIIRVLGVGGMGAVYQAWDAELGVAVALKVIRVDKHRTVASDAEKRFKQELLLARQVTHKHVVRIHDLGEIDGIKYITMPYVEGEDLASVLRSGGKLPVTDALPLAREIAAGLQAAHDAGVVHRDLKPANIMVTRGDDGRHALIMDFGISASADASASDAIVGTLEYMAPEQAKGMADARSDVYAFGLILYEMLTGPRLNEAATAQARIEAMRARFADGVAPLRVLDATIPEPLERFVMKCVATDPAERFEDGAQIVSALATLDDAGARIRLAARLTKRFATAASIVILLLLGGTYYTTKRLVTPDAPHDPVSVVIADLQNTTGDTAFDHTLEPMLRRALEGAGFINAYDRSRIRGTFNVKPASTFDAAAARELALQQGVGVVLSGRIDAQPRGYLVALQAIQTVSGNVIVDATKRVGAKDEVLGAATTLVGNVRKALGDKPSETDQLFARSMSATSLAVVARYTEAVDALSNGKYEAARQALLKTLELDPGFGLGYQGLSVVSRNMGKLDDANRYLNEALRHLDGMSEREQLGTRGFYYRLTGDYQQCVKENTTLITRYAADVGGHNQRALCLSKLRDLDGAVAEMREVVKLVPKRVIYRDNLALYAAYDSDFDAAEQEASRIETPDVYGTLALAFAQLGQGAAAEAAVTYRRLATVSPLGASLSASGLGDLAMYQGRSSEAAKIFADGAASDLAAGNRDRASRKLIALANVRLARGQVRQAREATATALANSRDITIRFLAARVYVEANAIEEARALAGSLSAEVGAEPQAYGKIVQGEIALKTGQAKEAVRLVTEANGLLDTWIGHFVLGRAYFEIEAWPQADSEFDRCIRRRGEALALFLDEEPSFAVFPTTYYFQGRVREALKTARFADSYRAYLSIRDESTDDSLAADARSRIAQ